MLEDKPDKSHRRRGLSEEEFFREKVKQACETTQSPENSQYDGLDDIAAFEKSKDGFIIKGVELR